MVLAVREHQGEFIVFGSISVRPSSLRYLSGPGSVGAWGEATGTLFFNDLLTAAQGGPRRIRAEVSLAQQASKRCRFVSPTRGMGGGDK
jgi:hypothetical protein